METKTITVVCEPGAYDNDHSLQILSKARALGQTIRNSKVIAICIGAYKEERLNKLKGIDLIVIYRKKELRDITGLIDVTYEILNQTNSELVLFPASLYGREAAARLSIRMDAGLTADCIDIEAADDFYFCRAAINQTVLAKIKCINCSKKMCTVKKDVFMIDEYDGDKSPRIKEFVADFQTEQKSEFYEILESFQIKQKQAEDIHAHEIVFCIGRGAKGKTVCDRIYRLAKHCGAGVVGTRAAVEEKMIEKERQIGQSGKSIAPKLYVGFGVSGANQHMVGIKNASTIIAINNNENEPIFDYADYPIIENIEDVVTEMEKQLVTI